MGYVNWFEPPRYFGDPFQTRIDSIVDARLYVKERIGKTPLYTTVYPFPTFQEGVPFQVKIDKLFTDMDAVKPENALLDVRKVSDFLEEKDIPNVQVFSGEKGFHNYILFKPEVYVISDYVSDMLRAINLWLIKELELRTVDLTCAEPRRLCRLWYTPHGKYYKREGTIKMNKKYCYPLSYEQLHNWDISEIIENSLHPTVIKFDPLNTEKKKENYMTISEFLKVYDIDVKKIIKEAKASTQSKTVTHVKYREVNDSFLKKLIPRPCIHYQLVYNPNPPHIVRFSACLQLKWLGYDPKFVFDFFQDLNFIDKVNTAACAYQINHVFKKDYKHPSCSTLKKHGLCIGAECTRYNQNVY